MSISKAQYLPTSVGKIENGIPTAIFHGLNDNCTNNAVLVQHMSDVTNGSYVRCVEIGNGRSDTWWTSLAH